MYSPAGFYDVDNERVAEKDFQFKPKMLSELEGKKKSEEEAARKKVPGYARGGISRGMRIKFSRFITHTEQGEAEEDHEQRRASGDTAAQQVCYDVEPTHTR